MDIGISLSILNEILLRTAILSENTIDQDTNPTFSRLICLNKIDYLCNKYNFTCREFYALSEYIYFLRTNQIEFKSTRRYE
ncbi:hypothetical protein BpHYR1_049718 [Brachionus plicatilis]|uniref:Uncharacterized protein n=1 Tax=Brachionus plicatilis TaxID=10195 RepID=A0A3M7RPT2_BRAPC|nr:hypothetical protein BpHYR1_049718 [Brachionus plicatilis]